MAVASLVLGIVALVMGFIPGVGLVGIVVAIVAVILGALGRKDPAKAGLATGGLVCGIIALALSLIVYFACGGAALCTALNAASRY